jgi:hypothetical protein
MGRSSGEVIIHGFRGGPTSILEDNQAFIRTRSILLQGLDYESVGDLESAALRYAQGLSELELMNKDIFENRMQIDESGIFKLRDMYMTYRDKLVRLQRRGVPFYPASSSSKVEAVDAPVP